MHDEFIQQLSFTLKMGENIMIWIMILAIKCQTGKSGASQKEDKFKNRGVSNFDHAFLCCTNLHIIKVHLFHKLHNKLLYAFHTCICKLHEKKRTKRINGSQGKQWNRFYW